MAKKITVTKGPYGIYKDAKEQLWIKPVYSKIPILKLNQRIAKNKVVLTKQDLADAILFGASFELLQLAVHVACEEGWQYAYNVVQKALGVEKISLSEMWALHDQFEVLK